MLRYKTETRPGLVALNDIRPGNGAGPFLQPRSPHGTRYTVMTQVYFKDTVNERTAGRNESSVDACGQHQMQ